MVNNFSTYKDFVESRKLRTTLDGLVYSALGLAGETGEVVEVVKKGYRPDETMNHENLKLELGDVLYYWTALCYEAKLSQYEVMEANIKKLLERDAKRNARLLSR